MNRSPESSPQWALEEQLAQMRSRIYRLEQALARNGIELEDDAVAHSSTIKSDGDAIAPPVALGAVAEETRVVPPFAPMMQQYAAPGTAEIERPSEPPPFAYAPQAGARDARSLENRIGSQWFNRIGILAVLIGMAWFLKFAVDNHWIGPLGRVVIGLVAGAGLIGWSQRFLAKGYRVFSYSLKAVGSGTLYLALWAAFALYHLIASPVAFLAMIAVTAFNGYLAWAQDAELLALYAIAGGLSTPLLLSTGENHEVALFSYLLMLDMAVLLLTMLRSWSRILVSAFAGTVFFVAGWSLRFYGGEERATTVAFVACFFLLFAVAPLLVRLRNAGVAASWDALALVVLPMANASLGFVALLKLMEPALGDWTGAWLAVGFAAFYLVLLRAPAVAALREAPPVLAALHLTVAVVFLTLAIPLKTQGRWLTIGWLVEGAVLLWAAIRLRSTLLRGLALLCLMLGLLTLVVVNPAEATTPVFNARFGAYLAGIAIFGYVAWLGRRESRLAEEAESWKQLAAAAVLVGNGLILLAVSLEIHNYWWMRRWHDAWAATHAFRMDAQFSYSAWFMAFGAALLAVGFWKRSAFVRWQALILVAVAIAKVFLFDMSQLSQGYRILSFLGLGVLLLGVSFVYQRDWLHLRGHEEEALGSEEKLQ